MVKRMVIPQKGSTIPQPQEWPHATLAVVIRVLLRGVKTVDAIHD